MSSRMSSGQGALCASSAVRVGVAGASQRSASRMSSGQGALCASSELRVVGGEQVGGKRQTQKMHC